METQAKIYEVAGLLHEGTRETTIELMDKLTSFAPGQDEDNLDSQFWRGYQGASIKTKIAEAFRQRIYENLVSLSD